MDKIVVFASGTGSNFQAIIDAVETGQLKAEISGLIASKPAIGAIEKAVRAGIPYQIINPSQFGDDHRFAGALLESLQSWEPDLIVLAGYKVKIPADVVNTYPGKIINIHPALLPKYGGKGFYGMRVHRAVLEAGETESGCTVHLVNNLYDQGPVLAHKKVNVRPDDTPQSLAERVLKQEHRLLPEVIQQLLNKKQN